MRRTPRPPPQVSNCTFGICRGQVHRPRVWRNEGKGNPCAWKALSAASSCAKIPTKPIVLLASGTGFAPIKALLEHMQFRASHAPPRCTGAAADRMTCTCTSGWSNWLRKCRNCATCPWCLTRCPEDQWTGRTGFVHQAVLDDFADLSGHQVYACGAPIVVESARTAYTAQRVFLQKSSSRIPSPPKPTNTARRFEGWRARPLVQG